MEYDEIYNEAYCTYQVNEVYSGACMAFQST